MELEEDAEGQQGNRRGKKRKETGRKKSKYMEDNGRKGMKKRQKWKGKQGSGMRWKTVEEREKKGKKSE